MNLTVHICEYMTVKQVVSLEVVTSLENWEWTFCTAKAKKIPRMHVFLEADTAHQICAH